MSPLLFVAVRLAAASALLALEMAVRRQAWPIPDDVHAKACRRLDR
jgi:hypothetical protein